MSTVRWLPYGESALLVEFSDPQDRWNFHCPLADEVIVGAATVLVRFDPARHRARDVIAASGSLPTVPREPVVHRIPVRYDGPDLTTVADAVGLSAAEVVERHAGSRYRAEFCGFAPGFTYLSGLDPALHLPRRSSPRSRVPAGSVAIAADWCAAYPTASPGGWHLIGTVVGAVLFDADRPQPALLAPGDVACFEVIQ